MTISPYDADCWEVFFSLARTGSFARTAMETDRTTPNVSRRLRTLEQMLGGPLVDRSVRPCRLTPLGERVLNCTEAPWRAFASAVDELRGEAGSGRTRITVSGPIAMCKRLITDMVYRYAEKAGFPDAVFEVKPGMKPEDVLEGSCDILFTASVPQDQRLASIGAIRGSTVPLASPGYLAAHGEPLEPADLVRHDGIVRSNDLFSASSFLTDERTGRRERCRFRTVFVLSDMEAIRDALLGGRGITIDLPISMFVRELEAGELVPILRHWKREPWDYSVIYEKASPKAPVLKQAAEFFALEAGEAFDASRRTAYRLVDAYWAKRDRSERRS
ncbi:MAG: LysR substrate-binding domain-containing protein [Burkholderia sp.]|jgi:LysR family transcriptional regulator, regulator for bpeEF and oprC